MLFHHSTFYLNLHITVPVTAALTKIFGSRWISLTGFFLQLVGMTSAAFGTQIWHLIIGWAIPFGEWVDFVKV